MAEYINNGVDPVYIDDKIHFEDPRSIEKPCCFVEYGRDGFIFNKSGLYSVSISGNYTTVTNVTPQKQPCDGCKYDKKPDLTCLTCARKCVDHYEKEE